MRCSIVERAVLDKSACSRGEIVNAGGLPTASLPATNAKRLRTGAKATKRSIFHVAMPSMGCFGGACHRARIRATRWLAMTLLKFLASWLPPKLSRRALGQNTLQRAAMHVEPPRGLGDVTVAHLIDPLNVLPTHAIGRHRIARRLGLLGAAGKQCRYHIVGVGRFRQVIHRAHLHRGHGGGDVAVAGQHDSARVRTLALQRRHYVKAVAVAEPQIYHGKGRRRLADLRQTLRHAVAGSHQEAAAFHRPRQSLQKWPIILHNQERAVGVARQFGDGVHVEISLCPALNIWRRNAALPRPHKVDQAASQGCSLPQDTLSADISLISKRCRGHAIWTTAPWSGKTRLVKETLAPVRSSSVRAMNTPSPNPRWSFSDSSALRRRDR